MTKSVSYARVSSKEQEQEGFSIPAQLTGLTPLEMVPRVIRTL